jgi:serpin B
MTEGIDLIEHLRALGMKDAFGAANCSGISPSELLMISAVVHKAFISVDEMGTEAAAATAVEMSISDTQSPTPFGADHPFLFV